MTDLVPWLERSARRMAVLMQLTQPSTPSQLACKIRMRLDSCIRVLGQLRERELVMCLTPQVCRGRLYGVTALGRTHQQRLCDAHGLPAGAAIEVDSALYASVCFPQRAAVVKALTEPMQPPMIRRRVRLRDPQSKLSRNNTHDVLMYLLACELVQQVEVRGKCHRRYVLTDQGKKMQRLLWQAQTPVNQLPLRRE